jgi:hypothetical protein
MAQNLPLSFQHRLPLRSEYRICHFTFVLIQLLNWATDPHKHRQLYPLPIEQTHHFIIDVAEGVPRLSVDSTTCKLQILDAVSVDV